MPVFNFDLEDGKPPVSFNLKQEDTERFMAFLAEVNGQVKALHFLVEVKEHKDKYGKDEWYNDAQPMAWEQARKALGKKI